MIVPPALQDLPETMTPESSASSSVRDNGGDHHTSSSSSSSSKETPSCEERTGNVVPKDLPARFRFKAALHHEVADSAPSISGYRKLEEMVRAYHIPRTILLQTGRPAISPARANIRLASGLRAGSDAADAQQHKVHHRLYAVVCEVGGTREGDSVQVAVPVLTMSQLQRRKVEGKFDRSRSPDYLGAARCVRVCRHGKPVHKSVSEPKAHEVAKQAAPHKDRRGSTSGLLQHHNHTARRLGLAQSSGLKLRPSVRNKWGAQPVQAAQPEAASSSNVPSATARAVLAPRITHAKLYATHGSSTGKDFCAAAWRAGCHGQADGQKASLVDDVNCLQGSGMANRATAAAESRADELANRNNELREKLKRAHAEKESGIQAAKEEAARIEERAKKVEAEMDCALNELGSLRHQVVEADNNLNATEGALNELKISHGRSISIARAQKAKWLVVVASANMTTEIYNEIRGKVLHHRPDFPIRELAFFDGEDIDEQGKGLAPLADTTVRLRWDLNEEGEPSSTPPNSQPTVVSAKSPVNAPALEPTARSSPACSSPRVAIASMPVDLMDD
ncbi:hypothetical protein SLEP1_g14279 [Rubroshorea leprosula]|uniref:Uncharacterized protein n=1 Tax=Rubroshorea leprosula TaxID=152421 RepID=A0AAV5IV26_9ROSI|nr:hypothetical protein SLEP1_g14279 [Rubroshorea leprosula]